MHNNPACMHVWKHIIWAKRRAGSQEGIPLILRPLVCKVSRASRNPLQDYTPIVGFRCQHDLPFSLPNLKFSCAWWHWNQKARTSHHIPTLAVVYKNQLAWLTLKGGWEVSIRSALQNLLKESWARSNWPCKSGASPKYPASARAILSQQDILVFSHGYMAHTHTQVLKTW